MDRTSKAAHLARQRYAAGIIRERLLALRTALAVAEPEFVFDPRGDATWTSRLPMAWSGLVPELARLDEQIEAWLASKAKQDRPPGAPADRFHLRLGVFDCLSQHGIKLQNGPKAIASRGLATVLGVVDELERVLATLRGTKAASTMNKYLQTIKALEKWGRRKGYLSRPWLSEFTSPKREKHAKRDRRLVPDELTADGKVRTPGEERRLLAACTPWLQRLVIAAIETGCRRGELLSLQWADVNLRRHELTIRAEKAKDGDTRTLPISQRLLGVLEMVRHGPAGKKHGPATYVFGDAVGGKVADPKKAWATACKRAKITGLHFHDLRHEAGSRLLEAGWPLHHVQEMLGHADLKQTSTYLNVTQTGLQESMRRFGTTPDWLPETTSVGQDESSESPADAAKPTRVN